jgi:copper chaperone CopZ
MHAIRRTILALGILAFPLAAANAASVIVKGVHLCCGACVQGVAKALKDVKGVSQLACDRDGKTVAFTAADDKAAKAGIAALAKGGYGGVAIHGGKPLAFPASGVKKGLKANSVTFVGIHLCCGGCVNGAKEAVEQLDGVTAIDVDRKDRTITVRGKDISVAAASAALFKGGFYGKLKTGK